MIVLLEGGERTRANKGQKKSGLWTDCELTELSFELFIVGGEEEQQCDHLEGLETIWRGLGGGWQAWRGLTSGEKTLAGAGLPFVLENSTQSTWPTLTSCLLFCSEEKIIWDFVLFSEADISTSISGPIWVQSSVLRLVPSVSTLESIHTPWDVDQFLIYF